MAKPPQIVDPTVSRAKFDREVDAYRDSEDEHLTRGWWLLKAEFPEVFVVFATPVTRPPAVAFGVLLDFTNYDLWAPSVQLVNPFTRAPYRARELPTVLTRRLANQLTEIPGHGLVSVVQEQSLMQGYDADAVPFLCLPGVREYHENPGHTGDSWLLRRQGGEGTLYFLLEKLYQYGVQPINGYHLGLSVTGFSRAEAPP